VHWSFASTETELGLRIATALVKFWTVRGLLKQGRTWLEQGLHDPSISQSIRARALVALGEVIWRSSGPSRLDLFSEASTLAREVADDRTLALALRGLAIAQADNDNLGSAANHFEQSLELFHKIDDKPEFSRTLFQHGMWVSMRSGLREQAHAQFTQSLEASRAAGDRISTCAALYGLGVVLSYQGDHAQAIRLFSERLTLCRELRYSDETAITLNALGTEAFWTGRLEDAQDHFLQARTEAQSIGSLGLVAEALEGLALILEVQNKYPQAATHRLGALQIRRDLRVERQMAIAIRSAAYLIAKLGQGQTAGHLLGAAETIVPQLPHPPRASVLFERRLKEVKRAIGFDAAVAAGRRIPLDDAVHIALSALATGSASSSTSRGQPVTSTLSRREREVAAFVAEGLPNRAIAERLFISERTVETHVQHILNKLAFTSRAQVAAWVVRQEGHPTHQ
jgi:non-specific serine/threonine protein kinase